MAFVYDKELHGNRKGPKTQDLVPKHEKNLSRDGSKAILSLQTGKNLRSQECIIEKSDH